jgi:hypothetical protein
LAVIGKLFSQFNAEQTMRLRGGGGVLEIIRELVALIPEIKPGLRVLMHKQRSKRTNVTQSVVFEGNAPPGGPGVRFQRVRRGAHAEQVHHHQFAVILPAVGQKTDLRHPP